MIFVHIITPHIVCNVMWNNLCVKRHVIISTAHTADVWMFLHVFISRDFVYVSQDPKDQLLLGWVSAFCSSLCFRSKHVCDVGFIVCLLVVLLGLGFDRFSCFTFCLSQADLRHSKGPGEERSEHEWHWCVRIPWSFCCEHSLSVFSFS